MLKFALAGNPNSGKTTLFNSLTGSTAQVGNWPGVTVDKKVGTYKAGQETVQVVDLPGIYSLSPYTPEEVVSRNFLIDEKPDCVINIIDATNLERNLYLTTQLLEIDVPVIIALNMMDAALELGEKIDIEAMMKIFQVPVVPISALKNEGLATLMQKALIVARHPRHGWSVIERSSLKKVFDQVHPLVESLPSIGSHTFHIVKFIEGDEMEKAMHPHIYQQVQEIELTLPLDNFKGDFGGKVADARYNFITEHFPEIVRSNYNPHALTKSDKIDRILTNKWLGIPIFFLTMLLVFHIVFSHDFLFLSIFIPKNSFDIPIIGTDAINSPGVILSEAVTYLCDLIGLGLTSVLKTAPTWLNGLIVEGLWAGLSTVLGFIPLIISLFFFITLLEDSGYMARAAFIMDRAFRRMGLSGRSFVPLLMSFGCAVPGIMATRTLESEKERRLTIMLTPFFSCSAKLQIWAAFGAFLYQGQYAGLVVFLIYLLGILVSIIAALLLSKLSRSRNSGSPFIMELPAYHIPQAKNVGLHLWEKLKDYLHRAATIIAGSIVVIWFLSSFSFSFRMVDNIDYSMLGQIAKVINYVFYPLGWAQGSYGWMYTVASFTGLVAKEMVPATLGTFAGISEEALIGSLSLPAAFSFMAFNLLTVPCMASVSAARSELRSRRKFIETILFWIVTSYVVSMIVYWVGTITILIPVLLFVLVLFFVWIFLPSKKDKKVIQQ
ncbi:MAG TPA: ferrous iron transport protein B [Bacilli bacterium]|nr:ferrous iron transport protein B [Bacilli bacterium]